MKKEAYLKDAHMDKSMRVIIKEGILSGKSLNEIAKQINKDPTTVSKEVKKNRIKLENNKRDFLSQRNICETFCKNYSTCKLTKMCSRLDCLKTCKNCIKKVPMFECPSFIETPCQRLMRFPYVCNGCQKIRICLRTRYTYDPDNAYKTYQETLKESRSKLQINEEQYDQMNYLLNEGVKRGLSPYVVMLEYPDEFPYSIQRIYQLIREGKLMTIPLDLTRAVRRKTRTNNKTKENKGFNLKNKIDDTNRTFSDYVRWTLINNVSVFQMDSVIGKRDESVALLTLIHVKTFLL